MRSGILGVFPPFLFEVRDRLGSWADRVYGTIPVLEYSAIRCSTSMGRFDSCGPLLVMGSGH